MTKPDGLYPNFLNPTTGNWGSSKSSSVLCGDVLVLLVEFALLFFTSQLCIVAHGEQVLVYSGSYSVYKLCIQPKLTHAHIPEHISLGALGDSFYEYLLKSWLMTSKDDVQARDMFYDALGALEKHLVKKTVNQITYVTDVKNGRPDGKMQHLVSLVCACVHVYTHTHIHTRNTQHTQACFSGGMFALGAQHAINGQSEHYMDVAKALADTCHNSYQRTGVCVHVSTVHHSKCICTLCALLERIIILNKICETHINVRSEFSSTQVPV